MNGKSLEVGVGLLGVGQVAIGSIFTESEKIEIRGAGPRRGNPPEVDICMLLTANSTYLLQNTTDPSRWMRGPLFRAACSTTNFRAARPLHFTRVVVRRED